MSDLLLVPAPDDSGAETADRFEWQAAMATAHALSLYLDALDDEGKLTPSADFSMICEHHEDWALARGLAAEIVSAKHRETSYGAYTTVRKLLVDGGVLHLFDRWKALNKLPTCRLVTTPGVSADGAKVHEACAEIRGLDLESPLGEIAAQVVQSVIDGIAELRSSDDGAAALAETTECVRAFLRALWIQHSEPRRQHLPHAAPTMFAEPVAARLTRPDAARAIWSAVHTIVRERMRAAGPHPRGNLPTVLGAADEPEFERRTVTASEVDAAVRIALAHVGAFEPLKVLPRTNRMAVKMDTGRCGVNAIERAEDLRLDYQRYRRERGGGPGTLADTRKLQRVLMRLVDQSEQAVASDGGPWGDALWREIEVRLASVAGTPEVLGLDTDMLLGGVSDLSNRCKVWYSEPFDVAARIAAIRRGEASW